MSRRLERSRTLLRSGRGPLAILLAAGLAAVLPPPASAGALVAPIVAVLVFTALRGFSPAALSTRSAGAVALALAIGYLAVPGLAALAAPLDPGLYAGLLPVLVAPTTVGSAIVWTRVDGGDVTLTTTAAAVSVGLSPVVVPALLAGLGSAAVSLDPLAVALDLLVVLVAGGALAYLVPEGAVPADRLDDVAVLAIGGLVYVAVGTTGLDGLGVADVGGVALAVLAVDAVAVGLAAGVGRLVGLDRARRRSVAYVGGLKNLGLSLLVARSLAVPTVLPVVAFYVVQQLAASVRAELAGGR